MTNWRLRYPALAALAGLALAGTALAAVPATASPHAPARASAAAKAGPWIVSDPAAYARAARSKDWVHTPEGLVYKSCVYGVPNGTMVDTRSGGTGKIIERSGAVRRIAACGHRTLAYPGASRARSAAVTRAAATQAAAAASSCENGDTAWRAESCWRAPTWLTSLSENFSVPSNPTKDGALLFFFPGLEDSSQDTILQPLLNWGANGSIVTNPNIWYIMSEYYWGGNWVHSPPKHISTPNTVTGQIVASGCGSGGGECTWNITTTVGSQSTNLLVGSSPAFTLVDGGAWEEAWGTGCVETPPNGHEAFRNLRVTTSSGPITPHLTPYTVNSQCSVHAIVSSTNTDILWSP